MELCSDLVYGRDKKLLALDTASTGEDTQEIFNLLLVTPTKVYPANARYSQQAGQVATELDIQESDGCIALNSAPGQQATVQVLRLRPVLPT